MCHIPTSRDKYHPPQRLYPGTVTITSERFICPHKEDVSLFEALNGLSSREPSLQKYVESRLFYTNPLELSITKIMIDTLVPLNIAGSCYRVVIGLSEQLLRNGLLISVG